MPYAINRLTAIKVKNAKPGRHADGLGLYLLVKPDGRKTWLFRYRDRITGKLRDKGLGPTTTRSLEEAREAAAQCRKQLLDGLDPIDLQREEFKAKAAEHAKRVTFGQCVDRYLEAHRDAWRNAKHSAQWRSTLDTYAAKLLPLPVAHVDTALVVDCLSPIWKTKTETATRTRQRIEAVLDWATARHYRQGENPARWRGHLKNLLASPAKLKKAKHRPRAALPYAEIAPFIEDLRARDGQAARALELQILTATRPGEATAAKWGEFDLAHKVWTIPAERMKAGKEHRIPLSAPALALLKKLPQGDGFLFPGRGDQPMTTAAPMKLLKELRPGMTAHGFRSSFRDWAGEVSNHPREVIEHALAHQLKDKAEAAYARGTLFDKRARLMDDWARWCETKPRVGGKVTNIRRKRA